MHMKKYIKHCNMQTDNDRRRISMCRLTSRCKGWERSSLELNDDDDAQPIMKRETQRQQSMTNIVDTSNELRLRSRVVRSTAMIMQSILISTGHMKTDATIMIVRWGRR